VATLSNIQADCPAGILTFELRVVVPPNQVAVTLNGEPVSLTSDVVFSGAVTITATYQTAQSLMRDRDPAEQRRISAGPRRQAQRPAALRVGAAGASGHFVGA